MASMIKSEILQVTKLRPVKGEARSDFLNRVLEMGQDLDDAQWKGLSANAQKWYNDGIRKFNAHYDVKDIPDFPGDDELEEEEEAPRKPLLASDYEHDGSIDEEENGDEEDEDEDDSDISDDENEVLDEDFRRVMDKDDAEEERVRITAGQAALDAMSKAEYAAAAAATAPKPVKKKAAGKPPPPPPEPAPPPVKEPVKAKAANSKGKPAPAPEPPKVRPPPPSPVGGATVIKRLLISNLQMSNAELIEHLKAEGVSMSKISISSTRSEFKHSIKVLQEAGYLQELEL